MEIFVFLFGLCVGSFANVLIDRLPKGHDVLHSRSRCDFCKKDLRWFELVPVASFILQGGRCRRCHKRLSWQYPLVELTTAVGFVILAPSYWYWLIFFSLVVIFMADLKYQIIPDSMVIVGAIGAMWVTAGTWEHVLTGAGAAAFFFLLWLVTRGKGMGLGDAKLAFLMGFLLGFPKIVVACYVAFLTGAIVGVILILVGKKRLKEKIAFGPFLVAGTAVGWLFGDALVQWWQAII